MSRPAAQQFGMHILKEYHCFAITYSASVEILKYPADKQVAVRPREAKDVIEEDSNRG